MKNFLKKLVPPLLLDFYRNKKRKYGYFGIYENWKEAKKNSTGYDNETITEKVKEAALKVKRGEAAYERDSVLFDKIEPSWPVAASLIWIASQNDNSLNVLDFGGALGTSYHQNKSFLKHLNKLNWAILEQKKIVDCGKELFEDGELHFYNSIEEYGAKQNLDAVLLSSALQYLESPYEILTEIIKLNPRFLIFDKTPFLNSSQDLITVQKVPKHIYDASYPSWVFDLKKFFLFLENKNFRLVAEFNRHQNDIFQLNGRMVDWLGFLFEKI